tara:strand:- start:3 stop:266 length:264 start_codon:yes stop_codon:yes gene_type:complete
MGMISKTPSKSDKATISQKVLAEDSNVKITVSVTKDININRLMKCWAKNVVGAPLTKPCNFKKAIIEPVKVIAPHSYDLAFYLQLDE